MRKNKTIFILYFLLFCQMNARAYEASISGFDGQYTNDKGRGTASNFSLIIDKNHLDNSEKNVQIYLENLANNEFLVRYNNTEVLLEETPAMLQSVKNARWSGFNFVVNNKRLDLSIKNALLTTDADQNLIDNLKLNCPTFTRQTQDQNELILLNCLTNSSLTLNNFESKEAKLFFANLLSETFLKDISIHNIKVGQAQLNIKNNNFTGSVRVELDIKATVKLEGSTHYDLSDKTIRVRIDRARVGILNITGMLFDELKKMESDQITVQRPYVIIKTQN